MPIRWTKYQRELIDRLRRDYDVLDARIEGSGARHSKLRFAYDGRSFSIPVSSEAVGRSRLNLEALLRRLLGPPPFDMPPPSRRLEDMMPDLPNLPNLLDTRPSPGPWRVTIAGYGRGRGTSGTAVWFLFDPAVRDLFKSGIKCEQLDIENWKFSPGDRELRDYSFGRYARYTHSDAQGEPFGAVQGEAIESNGELLVHLSLADRPPVKPQAPAMPPQPRLPVERVSEKLPPALPLEPQPIPVEEPPRIRSVLENQMREIVASVRRIEQQSPYRFTRLADGRLVWRAPTIE
jgi:hypothetical protein